MIGSHYSEHYEDSNNALETPSTEYIEDMLNFLDKQREIILESYNNIFKNQKFIEKKPPTLIYEINIPDQPIIIYKSCGICALVLLFLLATLCSTFLFSICKKNKKNVNVITTEPLTIKPVEINKSYV
tara:strand:- start:238 stop:621 length:384 start_codon:yes stop_codon:yes gene_type:complete